MKLKVINLFGEPSVGKSTTAAGLFFLMKQKGFNVELINEYAKQCVWEDRIKTLDDQLYITAKQNHQLERLRGKVEFVITDSPLILGILYSRSSNQFPSFHKLIKEVFDSYENTNILLKRSKPYNPIGRMQNEKQAAEVRELLINLKKALKIEHDLIDGDTNAPQSILNLLGKKYNFIA
jgi:nicotinamide riboside kinase